MIQEKSCGAVIYRFVNDQLEVVIQHMRQGHYSLPKGHVEAQETERQTARREILEETGLLVTLHRHFRHTIHYSPKPMVMKEVVFMLARARTTDLRPQLTEVQALYWMTPQNALSQLTYESDREVLRLAIESIKM